ncbi:UDP-N-acetylmuramate dehydrogenase [Frondihabitans australicus]|uniref:UDP-N-acetylenolpyruvoylglucosamine reductase n=1 Tax=Frondihabitans australicus TaxID=386892 RepID=A0A495IBP9_9MICO|nr:UDP-N-acetylmuramate dehydrogenase [Frondihabitans australicus]RKR73090.1 UDP-N-acetylmuramate dehydrogenase [Frondihabitans australicus]
MSDAAAPGQPVLADLTTIGVGGPAVRLVEPTTGDELLAAARDAFTSDEPWFVLGGGSNLVVADDGFDGTVIRVATRGIEVLSETDDGVRIRVAAGHPWDDLVAETVARGWSGIEALSGIPGSVGASPVQNIGAYGQEVSATVVSADFLDADTLEFVRVPRANMGLAYRTSVFKAGQSHPARPGVITAVEFELHNGGGVSEPVAYAQLASALGVALGDRVPVADVRDRVLALRASKGMVLDPADADTRSCGSFFTNPIVSPEALEGVPADAPRWESSPEAQDVAVPLGELPAPPPPPAPAAVKLSAAWLIEHSGIPRGFSLPGSRAAISSKHTLAITNRGGATAAEVTELARFVQSRVASEFGVLLHPEPILLGAFL